MIEHINKIIFLHIPKTGGTSIVNSIVGTSAHEHLDWRELKEKHKEYWDEYYKFTIVRNPFDWLVSMYHGMYGGDPDTWPAFGDPHRTIASHMSFPRFIKDFRQARAPGKPFSQVDIIGPEMDQIIRFENLGNEFDKLRTEGRLVTKQGCLVRDLSHDNRSPSRKEKSGEYKSYYTDELREIVERELEKDLKTFGYSYE
jgi:hypothetical protein|tara:strand:- start:5456 stop:6052 length:597 start_codon:yes stop_codon:yes gene_type:complete